MRTVELGTSTRVQCNFPIQWCKLKRSASRREFSFKEIYISKCLCVSYCDDGEIRKDYVGSERKKKKWEWEQHAAAEGA